MPKSQSQHVDHREWQGNIHLRKHGVGPVVDGILVGCIEPSYEEVDNGEQVRYEYHEVAHDTCTEACYGKEEIYSCHGGDESVDSYIVLLVHQSAVLPDA